MKPKITIDRTIISNKQCTGYCEVEINDEIVFNSYCIERGWNDNKKMISCIPFGVYEVVLEYSHRFKKELWEIKGVPNRSECKFHSANFAYELNGCIALGNKLLDINGDDELDVTSSVYTMNKFHDCLKGFKRAILVVE